MSALESGEHVASVHRLPARQQDTAATPPVPVVPAEPRPPIVEQVADFLVPPDIWSEDRPSLRKLWLYGVYGRWTHADGFVRFAGAVYAAAIAFPVHAIGYLALWITERPSRFFVAATVAALIKLAL